jgi:hypothetical protein
LSPGWERLTAKPALNRIADVDKDDRYGRGGLLDRGRSVGRTGEDDVNLEPHQLGSEIAEPIVVTFAKSRLEDNVHILDIAELEQGSHEDFNAGDQLFVAAQARAQVSDHHFPTLGMCRPLKGKPERQECNQLAPSKHVLPFLTSNSAYSWRQPRAFE